MSAVDGRHCLRSVRGREREETAGGGFTVPWGRDPYEGGEGRASGSSTALRQSQPGRWRTPRTKFPTDELPCWSGTMPLGCSPLGRAQRSDCRRLSITSTSSETASRGPHPSSIISLTLDQLESSLPHLKVCGGSRGPQDAVHRAPRASAISASDSFDRLLLAHLLRALPRPRRTASHCPRLQRGDASGLCPGWSCASLLAFSASQSATRLSASAPIPPAPKHPSPAVRRDWRVPS